MLALVAFVRGARTPPRGAAEARADQPVRCSARTIDGARYRVCEIPAAAVPRLRLVARDARGRPLRTMARVDTMLRARGERLLFATNAGIYEAADSATGMLVADGGRVYSRLNQQPGPPDPCATANFYCPPNGVFFVAGGFGGVLPTSYLAARAASAPAVELASQSGPMLLRSGRLARPFDPASQSRTVRNGVGIRSDGTIVFAISDDRVTFHQLATAFGALACREALYLDGTISRLYAGPGERIPRQSHDFAAMFIVTEPIATGRR
ncbi:MAG TPA: phosphodiester glycosidase family protein, partial [Longimicrobiaceae bacterium]